MSEKKTKVEDLDKDYDCVYCMHSELDKEQTYPCSNCIHNKEKHLRSYYSEDPRKI